MQMKWYGKPSDRKQTPHIPSSALEDASETIQRERHFHTWMDEIIARHEQDGGFENLEGKGKPLQLEGETSFEATVQRIFKDAGVRPKWVELQIEIGSLLRDMLRKRDANPEAAVDVSVINEKIRLYNRSCPSPLLQKPLVLSQHLEQALSHWE